jgi:hypothetical protein
MNVHINKPVTIQGASRSHTIIDAAGYERGLCIEADDVTIKDLTIKTLLIDR